MHREVKLILKENKHIGITDVEDVLHQMNPNLIVTEETILSLKQTMFFYEHIKTFDKPAPADNHKNVISDKEIEKNPPSPDQQVKDLLYSFRKQAKSGSELHNYGLKLKKRFSDNCLQKLIDHLVAVYSIEVEAKRATKKKKKKDKKQTKGGSPVIFTPKVTSVPTSRPKKHVRMPMTDEERRERNGDKRTREGYSSTGVRMATHEELVAKHNEKMKYKKEHPTERRIKAKIFISTPMGGQNKRY